MNTENETMVQYLADAQVNPPPEMVEQILDVSARLTARIIAGEMTALSDVEMSKQLMLTAIYGLAGHNYEMIFSAIVEAAAQLTARHHPTNLRPGTVVH